MLHPAVDGTNNCQILKISLYKIGGRASFVPPPLDPPLNFFSTPLKPLKFDKKTIKAC